ncbi:MAG: hypothetical protein EOO39_29810, partial [Cytophagaceae bacterium]
MHTYLRQWLVVVISLAHLLTGMAQSPDHVSAEMRPANPPYIVQVRHFSVEHGLPNRSVTRIKQDSQGFIWIGTDAGISR